MGANIVAQNPDTVVVGAINHDAFALQLDQILMKNQPHRYGFYYAFAPFGKTHNRSKRKGLPSAKDEIVVYFHWHRYQLFTDSGYEWRKTDEIWVQAYFLRGQASKADELFKQISLYLKRFNFSSIQDYVRLVGKDGDQEFFEYMEGE